jgi:hypothetical protein
LAKKPNVVDAQDLVTQAEAAVIRGVSLASINELVRRGRFTPVEMFGRKLLRRSDVLAFTPLKTGPKSVKTAPRRSVISKERKKGQKK